MASQFESVQQEMQNIETFQRLAEPLMATERALAESALIRSAEIDSLPSRLVDAASSALVQQASEQGLGLAREVEGLRDLRLDEVERLTGGLHEALDADLLSS